MQLAISASIFGHDMHVDSTDSPTRPYLIFLLVLLEENELGVLVCHLLTLKPMTEVFIELTIC